MRDRIETGHRGKRSDAEWRRLWSAGGPGGFDERRGIGLLDDRRASTNVRVIRHRVARSRLQPARQSPGREWPTCLGRRRGPADKPPHPMCSRRCRRRLMHRAQIDDLRRDIQSHGHKPGHARQGNRGKAVQRIAHRMQVEHPDDTTAQRTTCRRNTGWTFPPQRVPAASAPASFVQRRQRGSHIGEVQRLANVHGNAPIPHAQPARQQSRGRQHARMRRDQYTGDAQLRGQCVACIGPRRQAVTSVNLRGSIPRRPNQPDPFGHLRVHHAMDAERRILDRQAERPATPARDRRARKRRVQRHRAASKIARIEIPKHDRGICHRLLCPAASITRRSRLGTGGMRPDACNPPAPSIQAIEPPPAPIAVTSTIGTRTG